VYVDPHGLSRPEVFLKRERRKNDDSRRTPHTTNINNDKTKNTHG
jgi:hypothetical protein